MKEVDGKGALGKTQNANSRCVNVRISSNSYETKQHVTVSKTVNKMINIVKKRDMKQ